MLSSTGRKSIDTGLKLPKMEEGDVLVALGGNPNVGKSTVFNALTGLKQHTGNWPGKTVSNACGVHQGRDRNYVFVDLPGTYSLFAHSAEEEVARDFICSGQADVTVIVCDATCLERSLNLALQAIEITPKAVVCVNLLDEAERKGIEIDLPLLQQTLGVPVVGTAAGKQQGLDGLISAIDSVCSAKTDFKAPVAYPTGIEEALSELTPFFETLDKINISPRWAAIKVLESETSLYEELTKGREEEFNAALKKAEDILRRYGFDSEYIRDKTARCTVIAAGDLAQKCCRSKKSSVRDIDRKLDRIFTGRSGVFAMLFLLTFVLWLTISAANYPSALLSSAFSALEEKLFELFYRLNVPDMVTSALLSGVYRVLTWVVAVMLPPMAIFFPLFTLLEDFGYLPRVAFNLDHRFKQAGACGKQALTMCMGFGCNAAGVTGCRIIDSPRERLIATLTNNFVPCNGRFPTLIAIISMFMISGVAAPFDSLLSAVFLCLVVTFAVFVTFGVSSFLSKTILKGVPSSFTLELPPYRKPQIGKVIVRSVFDRTLFVLGRAAAVAAPAGLIIWLSANIYIGDLSLFAHCAGFLDPFARLFGLDGVILLAFILGFPANEIVVPIILMGYLATGSIAESGGLDVMRELLIQNGWTVSTAVCVMLFSLLHWPCSTTCITIKKETGSFKWCVLAVLLPTVLGLAACFVVSRVFSLFGI